MVWVLAIAAAALAYQAAVVVLVTVAWRTVRVAPRRTPADLGLTFSELRVPTAAGKSLHAWWVAAGAGPRPAVVLVHGWGRNAERTLPYVEVLHPAGFDVLAIEARHHGASDADGHASMKKFSEDIRAAIDFLVRCPGVDPARLAVVGLSIGGSAAIHAAAHDPRIRAVVTVGSFADAREAIVQAGLDSPLLAPAMPLALRYIEWRVGARFDELAPERVAPRARARLLLVHGEEDATVPVGDVDRLARAAGARAEVWRIAGRGHSDCHLEPGFAPRLTGFLASALGGTGRAEHETGAS